MYSLIIHFNFNMGSELYVSFVIKCLNTCIPLDLGIIWRWRHSESFFWLFPTTIWFSVWYPDIPLPSLLPQPCSVRHLAQHYLDINSVPRRSFFEFMALFSTNELEKEKLQEFCTPEGQVILIYKVSIMTFIWLVLTSLYFILLIYSTRYLKIITWENDF